jgi:hypothetical protein
MIIRKILTLLLVLGTYLTSTAQNAVDSSLILLNSSSHDFGKIVQGKPVTTLFTLVNAGKLPVTLKDVQASCGCTTPEFNRGTLNPGDSSIIKVGYNAAAEGNFQKDVTIYVGDQQKIITISGVVYTSPKTSAPLNSSVSFLKTIN